MKSIREFNDGINYDVEKLIRSFKMAADEQLEMTFSVKQWEMIIEELENRMDFDYSDSAIMSAMDEHPEELSFRISYIHKLQRELKFREAAAEIKLLSIDFPDFPDMQEVFKGIFPEYAADASLGFNDDDDDAPLFDDDDDDDFDDEDDEEVIEVLKQDIAENPEEHGLHFVLALKYLQRRNYKESLKSLIEAIRRDEALIEQLFMLAMQFTLIKDKEAEINYFKKLTEAFPLNPQAWLALSSTYSNWEEFDKEIEANQYVISLDPDLPLPYYNIACCYLEKEEYEEACVYFKKTLKLDKRDYLAYSGLGTCYSEQMQMDDAVKCFQKALSIQPSHEDAILGMLDIYYQHNDFASVDKFVKKMLKSNQMSFEVLYSMLDYYPIEEMADKIVELVPLMNKKIPSKKCYFDYFVAYSCGIGEIDLALAVIEDNKDLSSISKMVNYYFAALYFLKGDMVEGERNLEYALLKAPMEYETFLGLSPKLSEIPQVQDMLTRYRPD